MKPFKIIAVLFSALIMASSSFAQDKNDKIGTVNMQKLLAKYHKSTAVLETFKGYETQIVERNKTKAEEVGALIAEATEAQKKAETPSFSREKKEQFFREAQSIRAEAKAREDARIAWITRKKTAFSEKQAVELGVLRKEIMGMVRELGDAEGYDYIFDKSGSSGAAIPILSYTKDATSLTEIMLERINRDAPEESAEGAGQGKPEGSGEE
ncbi:MAG: OmpH family outer membrane protein [Akkermansiaceae bacterium]|nr:OmpH family outer membrane protein [Akkermansiaceae bacterium]